jgi:rare lipoprotein A
MKKHYYFLSLFLLGGCNHPNLLEPSVANASQSSYTTIASWYQHGARTANGERFNPNALTAAHRTYPFGTKLKVTNLSSGKSVIVTVNDRGPFIRSVGIDLSKGAAQELNFIRKGKTKVLIQRMF